MSTYVLIHGAWHGAWCWYRIIPPLQRAGHRVLALDLPGFGRDKTPVNEIRADTWSDYVCGVLETLGEPVILVGHSRGGVIISQVAERMPGKVSKLVYVTAFLLENGRSMEDAIMNPANSEASVNTRVMEIHGEGVCATLPDSAIVDAFYHRCPEEDVALARTLLQPEALALISEPLQVSELNFGQVPRAYIHCLQDHAITLPLQKQFVERMPCDQVMAIDTDHSPFFSAPLELAEQLLSLSA